MSGGADWRIPRDKETNADLHTRDRVYPQMLLQICAHYPGLPDVRTLTSSEIRFFYEGIRKELHEITKPRNG